MEVNVKTKAVCTIDIDSSEAFRVLCKTLYMDFVLDENTDFFIRKNEDNKNGVYVIRNGHDELYDERGDLFVVLRNVAVNMFPNTRFRNEDYIYNG